MIVDEELIPPDYDDLNKQFYHETTTGHRHGCR